MNRILMWAMSTLTVVVLLFGYHTSTSSALRTGASQLAPHQPAISTGGSGGTGSTQPGSTPTTEKLITGDHVPTRWGPVQVQITVAAGKITAVDMLAYPNGNSTDQAISSQSLPILMSETMTAQSAQIDMVSGATYTSEGYVQSLQSALDQAGL